MQLTTRDKRAIAPIIEELSDYKAINRGGTNLPLHYVPEASHSMKDIISACNDLNEDAVSQGTIDRSPLLQALVKTWPYIRIAKHDLHYPTHPITIRLNSWGFTDYSIHLASELYGNTFSTKFD